MHWLKNLALLMGCCLALGSAACSSKDADAEGRVCGLIDRDMVVASVTGSSAFRQVGTLASSQERGSISESCQLLDDRHRFLIATVAEVRDDNDSIKPRAELESQRATMRAKKTCPDMRAIDSDLGFGNACVVSAHEIELSLLTEHRSITLIAKNDAKDLTLDAITDIARNIDDNARG